jgi:hypothetical protein
MPFKLTIKAALEKVGRAVKRPEFGDWVVVGKSSSTPSLSIS